MHEPITHSLALFSDDPVCLGSTYQVKNEA